MGVGGDRLERDQVDAAAGSEAAATGLAGGIAGVAAAGDEQQVGLRAPAVRVADVEVFGERAEEADAGVRAPVEVLQRVVVAVVSGGPLVGGAVGIDPDLDAFPIVDVFIGIGCARCRPTWDTCV